jgi:hypothetical protein
VAVSDFKEFAAEVGRSEAAGYAKLLARCAATRDQVADLLRSYLEWRARTLPPAGRAHFHNNGFLKLTLWRHPETHASIRVHVWQASTSEGAAEASSVHDHRWKFASVVLAGRLQFTNFEQIGSPDGEWMLQRASDANADGIKQLEQATRCVLREVCTYELTPGLIHALDHRQLHRTPAPEGYAATLVLVAPPVRPFSRVVKPQSQAPIKLLTSTRSLQAAEIVGQIEILIERIHAAP